LEPEVFVLGIAPSGGLIPSDWWTVIDRAVGEGLSIVNGLHDLVGPRYPELAREPGTRQYVWDVRTEPVGLTNGTGAAADLTCSRLLMIGADMALGKMTAGLEITKAARARSIKTGFVATGQIGITITGAGIPLDAIRVDFASGAVQREVERHAQEGAELIVIEGQGSLLHPGSTSNLPLLRGSCPTHLVLCIIAGQTHLVQVPRIQIPPLEDLIRLYEDLAEACGQFPRPKTIGVCINTSHLSADEAVTYCESLERKLRLPCVDPIRDGTDRLIDAFLAS
jgi:uncharacterized NAD-dependent epimerase/dehydratase family protein